LQVKYKKYQKQNKREIAFFSKTDIAASGSTLKIVEEVSVTISQYPEGSVLSWVHIPF